MAHHQKDYSRWFVHKKVQMENTNAFSQLCLQHLSLQFILYFADVCKASQEAGVQQLPAGASLTI